MLLKCPLQLHPQGKGGTKQQWLFLLNLRAKTRINLAKIDTAVWAMQKDDLILDCMNLNANRKGQKHA
jgi:hypothetical protein